MISTWRMVQLAFVVTLAMLAPVEPLAAQAPSPTEAYLRELRQESYRFSIDNNDIITDSVTNLQWFRHGGVMSWKKAEKWAGAIRLDGGGWRLPTIEELRVLAQLPDEIKARDDKTVNKSQRGFQLVRFGYSAWSSVTPTRKTALVMTLQGPTAGRVNELQRNNGVIRGHVAVRTKRN